ncbi:MAG: sugar phosphate isomerase/epimerase [Chloroflexi bacterium]|nr:sugar phosphate isomerase/epimerase [Chloroflexota bacterium]
MIERHRFGLSTCWNGGRHSRPADLLDEHERLGFRRLEAYCLHTPAQLADLGAEARARGFEITSLHSPCPIAVDERGMRARWGDWLASTNATDRQFAVDTVKKTIDAAAELGARGIVIHLGSTSVWSRQRTIVDTIARDGRDSPAHRQLLEQAQQDRAANAPPHVDAAVKSILALGEHAVGTGVRLGVEARDGYQEIPSLDEMATVLDACTDLPVGYWHDAGHGAKLEYCGFVEHEEYLRRYADRLVGMHVHDTQAARDHRAPGQGGTDFAMLAKYVRPDTILTLELHADVLAEHIGPGVEMLLALGMGTPNETTASA